MPLVKLKQPETVNNSVDRTFKEILDELQATTSRTEKEAILNKHKDNHGFTEVLTFILDPYITTGLSDKKINKKVLVPATGTFSDVVSVLKYISEKNTGTDEVIANVQHYIRTHSPDMADFYKSLFTKSIRLGAGAITVNKVYGRELISKFDVMLAEKYTDYPNWLDGKNFTVTLKLDGIRCVAIKGHDGKVKFLSRQGQEIQGLTEIRKELERHFLEGFVLDGELLANISGTSAEQYKATTKIVRSDGEKTGVTFYAFDYLPLDDFENQDCLISYDARRQFMEMSFKDLDHITVLPALYRGTEVDKIFKLLELVRKQDKEGVMVNVDDAPYEFKRTPNLLKVKQMQDCDLEIIGFEEGSGRLEGTLGRITVDYKGGPLGVGSGFTDEQRKWFWENKDNLIGRVVKVQYFEETKNADGKPSLRFPVFLELREEGKEVSYA